MDKEYKSISASRIKTLQNCSWMYWCNYILKLPDTPNEGAMKGTVCHLIFELLLNKKHKNHYNKVVKKNHIEGSEAVNRLVIKHMKKFGIYRDSEYDMVNNMILVGLNHNFYSKGVKLFDPEYEFNIVNEEPRYNIAGFIDKWGLDKKNKEIHIYDYKSSKQKFTGDDFDSNIQAMLYSLVAKKTHPEYVPIVTFIFLRYGADPEQVVKYENQTLEGFEHYLEKINEIINNFSYSDAKSNLANNKPQKGKGFNGRLLCGRAKEKGQLKKDGTLMWHCAFKFPYDYFVLLDEKGKQVKSAFSISDFGAIKQGYTIDKREYAGCPAHNKTSLTNF